MKVELAYAFDSTQEAYRFLNELKHWSVKEVKASFYQDNKSVQVSYEFDNLGFDGTAGELDDLASRYGGRELG